MPLWGEVFTNQWSSLRAIPTCKGFIPKSGAQKIKMCLQKKSWRMLWRRSWSVILVYGGKKAFDNKFDSTDDNARLDIKEKICEDPYSTIFSSTSTFLTPLHKFIQNTPQVPPEAITVLDYNFFRNWKTRLQFSRLLCMGRAWSSETSTIKQLAGERKMTLKTCGHNSTHLDKDKFRSPTQRN